MGASGRAQVGLSFVVEEPPHRWRLEDEDVPETPLHDIIIEVLKLVLRHWVESSGRSALVSSNLGCRWDPSDARVGTDPDVVLIEPAPPEGERLETLRVWETDHHPPRLAVEVVSPSHPDKDYLEAPLRSARLGVRELWVFDPLLVGPATTGGPHRLQVWRLDPATGVMARIHAGDGPAYSPELDAWAVLTQGNERLRIAVDRDGTTLWPTAAEAALRRAEALEAELQALRAELASKP